MITSIDKAIVAVVMAAVYVINNFTNFHIGLTEEMVNGIAGPLGALLVWWIPNKP